MDFILALHSHLPWVLNHGRWPHGSDWLCEAAVDTYLPLLEELDALARDEVAAPVTIGITPVLANQLASPTFVIELEDFIAHRLVSIDEAEKDLAALGQAALMPLVGYWRDRMRHLRDRFRRENGDLITAFRRLESEGRLEIMGSAATHGFLPLLGREESIRLQLAVGRAEHERLFGRAPRGCWLPECAYRPGGEWAPLPDAPGQGYRRGVEEFLSEAGFRYFFTDAHMARAGRAYVGSSELLTGAQRQPSGPASAEEVARSPYRAYRLMTDRSSQSLAALVRDPRSSAQVWSRGEGYPGDEWYLEFHKIRWPGGLKLWRVSGPSSDLGAKQPYNPAHALTRAVEHGTHFARMLRDTAAKEGPARDAVVAAPFDTELFGHWWHEGPDFVGATYRALREDTTVRPVTASRHLATHPPRATLELAAGSWGADGDWSMWLNDETAWTWRTLWPLEAAFWEAAPKALGDPARRPVLAQAARALLLAQSSDWQFIISTGAVADYAIRRFNGHCDELASLLEALGSADPARLEEGQHLAAYLGVRDSLFPDVLSSVEHVLRGGRAF